MGLPKTATPAVRSSARLIDAGWLPLVEPWTDDRPDPTRWLATTGLECARREVEDAIRAEAGPIVVSGPTGHGKTLLLRSLRGRPPSGFAPLFVPFANVEPDELAAWILASVRRPLDRDPGAELARLLRSNTLSGERTLLLVDEVQAMPRATLAKLLEIIAASGVPASVVLAGLSGDVLDAVLWALPRSVRKIAVAEPWSRSDAELLLARVAFSLGMSLDDVLAAVDVEEALRAGSGNPRLVRAALAVRLRAADLRASVGSVTALAFARQSDPLAASASLARGLLGLGKTPSAERLPVAAPAHQAAFAPRRPPRRVASLAARVRARAATRSALDRIRARARTGTRSALVHAHARGRNVVDRLDRFAAGALAAVVMLIRTLDARLNRDREAIAASWRRAAQVLAAGIARLRRAAASGARFAQTRLEDAAQRTLAASTSASRNVGMNAHRLGVAARTRTIGTAADLRALARAVARVALARSVTGWGGARNRARQIDASGSSARAALRRRAAQVLAAGIAQVGRAAASGTRFAQTQLEGAVRRTLAASMRASRSVRMNAHRLGFAARTRTIATAADLRSISRAVTRVALPRSATGWSGVRNRARRIGASGSSARAALRQRVHRGLTGAAPLLRRGRARLAFVPVRSAISMAGSVAALALVIARASILTLDGPPGERIHFRVNSHPWSTVELDGMEAGATPFTIALEPGSHHFRVAMADGRVIEEVLVVSTERDRVAFR